MHFIGGNIIEIQYYMICITLQDRKEKRRVEGRRERRGEERRGMKRREEKREERGEEKRRKDYLTRFFVLPNHGCDLSQIGFFR